MPLLAIFLLFISNVAKAHGNIDILPKSNNKNSGSPFFGFSTAVNFYNAYRGEGREEINTAGNALSAFAGYSYGNLIFIGGYEHTFAPITYDGAFNSLQNGNLRQHPSPRKIWLPLLSKFRTEKREEVYSFIKNSYNKDIQKTRLIA